MQNLFTKAERHQKKLRLFLRGASGTGKTYSALLIAKTLGKKIALIDTEKLSSTHYSDVVDYDVLDYNQIIGNDHNPSNYIQLVDMAEANGYDVLIIDSFSHAWMGTGGILELNDKIANAKYKGNTFTAWKDTDRDFYYPLVNKIMLENNIHIICTGRTKQDYEISKDEKGKNIVQKLGTKTIQRDDVGYEFDTVLTMQENGFAIPDKDRTRIFDTLGEKITEKTGEKILSYLNSAKVEEVKSLTQVISEYTAKINSAKSEDDLMGIWSEISSQKGSTELLAALDPIFAERNKLLNS